MLKAVGYRVAAWAIRRLPPVAVLWVLVWAVSQTPPPRYRHANGLDVLGNVAIGDVWRYWQQQAHPEVTPR